MPPPDWQLPPGVSRELWDYFHDTNLPSAADAQTAGSPLADLDLAFARRQFAAPATLLDLGCGTGRAVRALSADGHRVVAVDLSEPMLRAVGGGWRLKANLVELDGLRDGVFDGAVCLFGTLGMIAPAAARRRFLNHVARLLRPGGRFVVHVHNVGHHWGTAAGRRWLAADLLRRLSRRSDVGDARMPPHDGRPGWTMHLFTRGELTAELRRAGLIVREVRPVAADGPRVPKWSATAYGFLVAAEAVPPTR